MKYSILFPYIERAGQLHNTLTSFVYHYKNRNDYEVIIVEDIKNNQQERLELRSIVSQFSDKININLQSPEIKTTNPCKLFNFAAKESKGEYLVITNPECFHESNILAGLDNEFKTGESKYVVCACKNAQKSKLWILNFNSFSFTLHSKIPYRQHSALWNRMLHFCSSLSKEDYFFIGGFDEVYADGTCYEDDDFLEKIKQAKTPIVCRDDLVVVHIEHSKQNNSALHEKNKQIFYNKWGKHTGF